ncbi:hypothetical protein MPER_11719, partial [Moniliophthora perniciosa FA553]
AHAEGEVDAVREVERLKRKLKQEVDARKRSEETTEEALQELGRLNAIIIEHEDREAEMRDLKRQLEDERAKNRALALKLSQRQFGSTLPATNSIGVCCQPNLSSCKTSNAFPRVLGI